MTIGSAIYAGQHLLALKNYAISTSVYQRADLVAAITADVGMVTRLRSGFELFENI